MPDIVSKLKVIISAQDKATATFSKVEKRLGVTTKQLKIAGTAVGGLAMGLGVKAVQSAARFEKTMMNVGTLIDTNTESLDEMSKRIKKMSTEMPLSAEELATALYQVRSAGIDAASQFQVLEHSAKLATAGLGTTQEAVDLMTSAINAFKLSGADAHRVSDILFKTVKAGKTTVADLAQSFGMVAPVAAEMGVKFDELQAATAALTTSGLKTSVAQTQIRAAISSLLKPTKEAKELFDKLGVETFKELMEKTGGLVPALKALKDATEGNEEQFAKAMSSVEGLNAALSLTGATSEKYNEILEDMRKGGVAVDEAYKKQLQTTMAQYNMLKNKLGVAMMEIGVKIIPILLTAIKTVTRWVKEAVDAWTEFFLLLINTKNAIKGVYRAASAKIGGIGRTVRGWLGFQHGGVVPGPIGKPVPAIVHGGETIIPPPNQTTNQQQAVGNTFNFNFTGAFIGDKDKFIEEIKRAIDRESELRSLGGI